MSCRVSGLRSKRVLTPEGIREAIVVLCEEGTIKAVEAPGRQGADLVVEDHGDALLMPGLVDSHVHVNEPGRTEWEGFITATRAAAAGGITTIADMPLNCQPVTTTLKALEAKLDAIAGKLFVDCLFWGGVVPGNTDELAPMVNAGVAGFKCFLIHSGIDEFPNVGEADLRAAMPILAKAGVPLLVHAELECGAPVCDWHDRQSYAAFVASRPRRWENEAIRLMLRLCEEYRCPVHIVHLSSSEVLEEIAAAKRRGLPFTVETCPHYLTFAAEEIPDGDTRYKCAPPIRERENRERLWQGLRDGTIDIVVSDHSPCAPDLKYLSEGDLQRAWGGISSLQFRLPTVWTEARRRGFEMTDIARWLCSSPAQLLGFGSRKGKIAPGFDADLVVWQPDEEVVFSADNIEHRHKVTPYEGRRLKGAVKATYVRGERVFDGSKVGSSPRGCALMRKSAAGLAK